MLGVSGAEIPHDLDGRANLYRSRLRGRRMLLVLDNVATAAQVQPLLPAEPRCRVLVTSRNRLDALDDADHVRLRELPAAEAVRLFQRLAGADDEEAVVGRVVDLCGRLPLAVRIARPGGAVARCSRSASSSGHSPGSSRSTTGSGAWCRRSRCRCRVCPPSTAERWRYWACTPARTSACPRWAR
ncbi:NB-ARC domain-containing protein [Lentzea guizhouensis]|uniref:NB-ARC domain-containing protein n=1 Tax=Lentzea guizhouensis TaxID=1586287 RepID=UPI001F01CD97|nr:NB-ARC domain-containing protein [Lentzea guizhouensis]